MFVTSFQWRRWRLKLAWLDRTPVLGRLVTLLDARAVTIYLWHNIVQVATSVVLVSVAVLAFGWVEDLAARCPLRLLPGARRKRAVRVEESISVS